MATQKHNILRLSDQVPTAKNARGTCRNHSVEQQLCASWKTSPLTPPALYMFIYFYHNFKRICWVSSGLFVLKCDIFPTPERAEKAGKSSSLSTYSFSPCTKLFCNKKQKQKFRLAHTIRNPLHIWHSLNCINTGFKQVQLSACAVSQEFGSFLANLVCK